MWESSGFKESASDNVLIASDGSGGSRETPKSVRQVAFGVATFSLPFKLLRTGFLGGQVPGRQTVPRAELWGAIQILSRVDVKSNIQIPIDLKVKSHLEGPSVITQNKIGFHHMLANSLADVVVEEAAKRLLPDLNLERKANKG